MTGATDEILNLLYELDEHIDLGRFEGAGALFADATLSVEGADVVLHGTHEVTAHLRRTLRVYDDGTCRTVRSTTNAIVQIEEDTGEAAAQAYFMVFQATPELTLQPVLGGVYLDAFRRRDQRWAFASRVVRVRLTGNLSQHVMHKAP
jgi:hypothetical protein